MNYFTSKIYTIRDKIVTMQPSATVSQQIVHYRSPEEQFHSFSTIGEEELYKLVKSSKPTTCMLDPIPSKLLKEVLPEVIDPLLGIINSSLSLGYVPKTFKLAVNKPLIKKPQLDPKDLVNYRPITNLPFLSKILEKVVSVACTGGLEPLPLRGPTLKCPCGPVCAIWMISWTIKISTAAPYMQSTQFA